MDSCCLRCEHCDAVDRNDDMVLCCMRNGDENPIEVRPDAVCHAFVKSIYADLIFCRAA